MLKLFSTFFKYIILGGQDGLVNVLGLTLGLVAANGTDRIILVAGLAAGFAEAISMGAVAYTSTQADKDHYIKNLREISAEYDINPEKTKDRIKDIFKDVSFKGNELDVTVETLFKNKELTTGMIVRDALGLQPIEDKGLFFSSFIVTISAFIGSLIPLFPFILLDRSSALIVSIVLSAIALFIVGSIKSLLLVGTWWKSGGQMVIIGLASAFAGFIIGLVLKI